MKGKRKHLGSIIHGTHQTVKHKTEKRSKRQYDANIRLQTKHVKIKYFAPKKKKKRWQSSSTSSRYDVIQEQRISISNPKAQGYRRLASCTDRQ